MERVNGKATVVIGLAQLIRSPRRYDAALEWVQEGRMDNVIPFPFRSFCQKKASILKSFKNTRNGTSVHKDKLAKPHRIRKSGIMQTIITLSKIIFSLVLCEYKCNQRAYGYNESPVGQYHH